ncbi:MAG: transposase [Ktedonobacteraceae bacterium]
MNCNTLRQVRQELYASFERRSDVLFDLTDALLCESQARSLAELSLSPQFRRTWTSVYKALQDGKIQIEKIRAILVEALLAGKPENEPVWMAVDGSNFPRPDARTSEDRTIIHLSNLPLVKTPIGVGWTFSSVVLIPDQTSSWTPIRDHQRITSKQTAIGVAIEQLKALKPLFGTRRLILLADRWYATPEFLRACHDLG